MEYFLQDLQFPVVLGCELTVGSDGIQHFIYESFPGFISYFRNAILSVQEREISNIRVFPNPVQDKLIIKAPNNQDYSISLTDLNGRLLFRNNQSTDEIDTSFLMGGVYLIKMETATSSEIRRFIKQ